MRITNIVPVSARVFVVAATAAAGILTYGCSSGADGAAIEEPVGDQSEAVLGATNYDSCNFSDVPNLELAYAYGRVAANSPAFAECISTAFSANLKVTPPGFGAVTIGPYIPCSTDPATPGPGTILTSLRTANPTNIRCDYSGGRPGVC